MSLKKINLLAETYARCYPWNGSYAMARTLLAAGSLLTLSFNDAVILFQPAGDALKPPPYVDLLQVSIFHLIKNNAIASGLCIGILLLVISGWRPRITGLLHWWVAFSFASSGVVIDGGDQLASVLCLLLLPLCLTDDRKWHWSKRTEEVNKSQGRKMAAILGVSTFFMIRLQVGIVYLHAAMGKFKVPEWENGTAIYYWFSNPVFGLPEWLEPLVMPIVVNAWAVTGMTWAVLVFELLLFGGLFMNKKWHRTLLLSGLAFHFAIFLCHGLFSFFFTMAAALTLYLGNGANISYNVLQRVSAKVLQGFSKKESLKEAVE